MTLVKYRTPASTASPVDRLASEIFGSDIARFFGHNGNSDFTPRVNIVEADEHFRVDVQAAGFDKKDLKVEMVDDTLTIAGEHTEEEHKGEVRWTRREFSRSAFQRSFVLPKTVKTESITADYVNGVLRLTIPKTEESKPKSHSISVR
ncbi:MAG: Hsp20/alpha crystallin family protein [Flavobacteriales bacterium]